MIFAAFSITIVLLHLAWVFAGTYFLNPEITLYPYFVSKGLTPYVTLIDQHFPQLLFGSLNLSLLGITMPSAAPYLFAALIVIADLSVAFLLYRHSSPRRDLLLLFVLLFITLDGRSLWLETFALSFTALSLALFSASNPYLRHLGLLVLSFTVGIKPQLLLLSILLSAQFAFPPVAWLLLLFFPALQFLYLHFSGLWPAFLNLLEFNARYYAPLAAKLPTLRQLLLVSLVSLPPLPLIKKPILYLLAIASVLVLSYPRFEILHLQLLSLVIVFFLLRHSRKFAVLILPAYLFILLLVSARYLSVSPRNFYYPPSLYSQAQDLASLKPSSIYILGGPDQLYQLTSLLPPGNLYLPSLPWYHADSRFVSRQLTALKDHPEALVSVNTAASVDGRPLAEYASVALDFVKTNYVQIGRIGDLDIYQRID